MGYIAKGGAFWEMFGNKAMEPSADVCRYASHEGWSKPGDSAVTVLPLRPSFS